MKKHDQEPELAPELPEGLERWSEHQREEVAAAMRETTEEDRRRAVEVFSELAKRPRGRNFGRVWLAAAALAVAVAFGWFLRGGEHGAADDGRGRNFLSPSSDAAMKPSGPVKDYDAFSWSPASEGTAHYDLKVWNEGETEPALTRKNLTESSYAPTKGELELLGPAIRWQVVVLDASNQISDLLGPASASRSSSR